MPNYRPIAKHLSSASVASGTLLSIPLSTTSWGLVLIKGSAKFSDTVLRSGAVDVWEDTTTTTTSSPDRQTFTDAAGEYGITCTANVQIVLKFYDN